MPSSTTDLFRAQSALMLSDLAGELGCAPSDLQSEQLIVVPRPEIQRQKLIALVATAGLGTVVSVEAGLLDWVREHAPKDRHFRAMQPFFLAELAAEAARRGAIRARAHGFSLGFALAERLALPSLPSGLGMELVDRDWMARYRPSGAFDNAIGEPEEADRVESTSRAFAILDDAGEPLGVSGIWSEGPVCDEIGVDVRRESRGLGLARPLVIAATNNILERGRVPFYSCGATNIRSHRNALACGFQPLYIRGIVVESTA